MALILLAVLIAVPVLELVVIIKVGGAIGVLPTILLLIGIAVLGTLLLRAQGAAAMRRASEAIASGRPPLDTALDGIGLVLAGVLMLTPGFLTDILGLLLLVPPLRRSLLRLLLAKAAGRVVFGGPFPERGRPHPNRRPPPDDGPGPVIEGEFRRVEEPDTRRPE